jgi:hypothetical protein
MQMETFGMEVVLVVVIRNQIITLPTFDIGVNSPAGKENGA